MKYDVLNLISSSDTFIILTHKRPDIDTISSLIAIFWYLLSIGKKKEDIDIVIEEYNKEFYFINGIENIKIKPCKEKYDLAIMLDSIELKVFKKNMYLPLIKKTIYISNKKNKKFYADYNLLDINAPSFTFIVYDIFGKINDINYLNCIAIGLISKIKNLIVSEKISNIFKELEDSGVNIKALSNMVLSKNKNLEEVSYIVLKLEYFCSCKMICLYLLQNYILELKRHLVDMNNKLIIKDIENLLILIKTTSGEFKCLLINFNNININKVCIRLINEKKIEKCSSNSYLASFIVRGTYEEITDFITLKLK